MKKILLLIAISTGLVLSSFAQDEKAPEAKSDKPKYARATFKSTRIINFQSVEMMKAGNLQFMISHHFGPIWNKDETSKQNFANLFGLNSGFARTYLALDYSPKDWLNLGLAAAGQGRFEGWAKFKIARQQSGVKNVPVTIAWFSMASADASKNVGTDNFTWNKFSYMHQLLIARKFNDKLSLQLSPTVIHFNTVPYGYNNSNTVFSMGIGGKYRLFEKTAVTFEYSHQFNMYKNIVSKTGELINYKPDLVAIGLEFDTGGHLFQIFAGGTTNSSNIDQFARNSNTQFALGFNINRGFKLK